MTWTVTIQGSALDKSPVGNVAAVWNAGQPDEFTYAGRSALDVRGISDFAVAAKAALALRERASLAVVGMKPAFEQELNK